MAPFCGRVLQRVVDQVAERLGEQHGSPETVSGPSRRAAEGRCSSAPRPARRTPPRWRQDRTTSNDTKPERRRPASISASRSSASKMRITRSTSATAPSISAKASSRGRAYQGELFEPRAQLRQRRAQIMRDGVRYVAHAVHQQLDLVEHAVDGARQRVELIIVQMSRQPVLQVAVDDGRDGPADAVDPRHERAAGDEADQQAGDATARRRRPSGRTRSGARAVRTACCRGPPADSSSPSWATCTSGFLLAAMCPCRRRPCSCPAPRGTLAGHAGKIAGERMQRAVGQQQDALAGDLHADAGIDEILQPVGALAPVNIGRAAAHRPAGSRCGPPGW